MNDERIWSLAKEQQAWVSSVRRALHRVPEPGFREEKTKKLICEKLNEIGVAPVCERGWITAVVDSGEDGPVTGFRADFDALPVTEPRGCPFRSEHEGYMHACGHDLHTAILLGAARLLTAARGEWRGKVKLLFQLGLPSSAQSVVTNLSFILMTSLANGLSVEAGAAVGIVGKFNSVAILPVVAMASSVSAIAAQNIAAERPDRALRVMRDGVGISLAVGVLVFVLSQLFAEPILRLFKSDDAEVIRLGAKYLRAFCFDYLFVSFLFNMNSLINAAGHALFSMLSSMLSSIILRAPLAVLLSRAGLDIAGIGYAAPAATLAAILMALVYILSGKWKQNATGIHREPET